MRESHGLGSVKPSYVGVVSCILTGTCCCGGFVIVGVVRGSGVWGASSLGAGSQVVPYAIYVPMQLIIRFNFAQFVLYK